MRTEYNVREVYLGNGVTTEFTFDFKLLNVEHLLVLKIDDQGDTVWTTRANDTTYFTTVRNFGNVGGKVTLTAPLENGFTLGLLLADDEPTQPTKFTFDGHLKMSDLENTFDILSGQIQRIRYLLDRSIRLPENFTEAFQTELAEVIDESVIVFDKINSRVSLVPRTDFKGDKGDQGETGQFDAMTVTGELEYDDPTPMSVNNVGTATNAILEFILRKGPQGEKGESVDLITVSTDLPDDLIGGNGDVWIVLDDLKPEHGNLYQKIAGTYALKGNIKGPAGGVNSIDTEQGDLVYNPSGLYSARFNKIITATNLRDIITEVYDIQYVGPAVTLTSNIGVGPYEKGQAITAINFTAAVVRKSNDIAQVEFLQGASVLDTQTSGGAIPSGGNSAYAWAGSITDTTSFTARVTDVSGGGGPTTATGTRTFSYIYAYYHGAGNTGLNAAQIAALTKVVATPSANQRIDYTLTVGQVPYFAYPVSVGAINQITDENGFDVTSSWTITTKVLTNTYGLTASYYCCEFNNPAGANNSTFYTFRR